MHTTHHNGSPSGCDGRVRSADPRARPTCVRPSGRRLARSPGVLLALLFLAAPAAHAQFPEQTWATRWTHHSDDELRINPPLDAFGGLGVPVGPPLKQSMAVAADGRIYLVRNVWNGTDNDIRLLGFDATGALERVWRLDSLESEVATAVSVDSSGDVFVAGRSNSFMLLYRVSPSRGLATANYFLGQTAGAFPRSWNRARGVALATRNGQLAVAGNCRSCFGIGIQSAWFAGLFTLPFGAAGEWPRWSSVMPTSAGIVPLQSWATAVLFSQDGDPIITGRYVELQNGVNGTVVYRYDVNDGRILWTAKLPGNQGYGHGLALDAAGDVFVTGTSENSMSTAKIDVETGAVLWRTTEPAGMSSIGHDIAVDAAGDVYVAGRQNDGMGGGSELAVLKYNGATGQRLWSSRHGNGDATGRALALTADGGVVVTGADVSASSARDLIVLRYEAQTGRQDWLLRQPSAAGSNDDIGQSIALAADGTVLVGGELNGVRNRDIALLRIHPGTGVLLAQTPEPLFPRNTRLGGADLLSGRNAMVVDTQGNTVVTGSTDAAGTDDVFVRKIDAAGDTRWSVVHDSDVRGSDAGRAVALAANGDVVVAASSRNNSVTPATTDLLVTRHAGSDGRPRWTRRYDGPSQGNDMPVAIVVDAADDIVIAGSTEHATNQAFLVVKLDGDTGGTLWHTDAATIGHDAAAHAIALAANGDAIVTGRSNAGASGGNDYLTRRYAGDTGEPRWTSRYEPGTHGGGGDDIAWDVALDSRGDVFVTGDSPQRLAGGTFVDDGATLKLNGSTGLLLWQQRLGNNGNARSDSRAIIIDRDDNVYIAGSRDLAGLLTRISFVARYANAAGTPAWLSLHPTGSLRDVKTFSLDIDTDGNLYTASTLPDGGLVEVHKTRAADGNWLPMPLDFANTGSVNAGIAVASSPDGSIRVAHVSRGSMPMHPGVSVDSIRVVRYGAGADAVFAGGFEP